MEGVIRHHKLLWSLTAASMAHEPHEHGVCMELRGRLPDLICHITLLAILVSLRFRKRYPFGHVDTDIS